jgi:hypothetical protein
MKSENERQSHNTFITILYEIILHRFDENILMTKKNHYETNNNEK